MEQAWRRRSQMICWRAFAALEDSSMRTLALRMSVGLTAAVAAAFLSSAWAAQTTTEQSAVWTPKQVTFVYQGFTTRYSCDGLRDKLRDLLLKLGARKDLQVEETACAG